ncbi:MAG: hypothetical protein VR78_11000 [Hoeflea sp. BRH_c9]|nr:MAG: hypothetical protein VR78_11000 [Hoeflea sp. BRH_c9]
MKKIKIIAAASFEMDAKNTIVLDAGQTVRFPDGLADFLISKGAASTCLSDPVKSHSVELGDIDPAIFSEDGDMIRGYLTANARVRWHTPGKPANAANYEGRDQWASGLLYWFDRSVFTPLEKAGVAHRVHFSAKRVDAKIEPRGEAIDLGWLPSPADRLRAA